MAIILKYDSKPPPVFNRRCPTEAVPSRSLLSLELSCHENTQNPLKDFIKYGKRRPTDDYPLLIKVVYKLNFCNYLAPEGCDI